MQEGFFFQYMKMNQIQIENESQEYGAATFTVMNKKIKFRVAKLTPTKVGHFVAIWKRENGITNPHDIKDPYDLFLISVRDKYGFGQFIFTIFMFVLFLNMLGMMPYSFTVTSHIAVTFALAFLIFLLVTIVGFVKHGLGFFGYFAPKGDPIFMLPLLVIIEVISYFTRPISLSVRLFANMMAGHTMLKVFSGFVISMGIVGGWLPLGVMVAFTGLEILIAFLQAYVFTILTCIYLNDSLHMH